jgi:hypothetical protein
MIHSATEDPAVTIRRLRQRLYIVEPVYRAAVALHRTGAKETRDGLDRVEYAVARALDVLLSRDTAAPVAIRAWVAERLRTAKNTEADEQIVGALECARIMEKEGRLWTGPFPGLTLDEAERRYKEMVEIGNG